MQHDHVLKLSRESHLQQPGSKCFAGRPPTPLGSRFKVLDLSIQFVIDAFLQELQIGNQKPHASQVTQKQVTPGAGAFLALGSLFEQT